MFSSVRANCPVNIFFEVVTLNLISGRERKRKRKQKRRNIRYDGLLLLRIYHSKTSGINTKADMIVPLWISLVLGPIGKFRGNR